MTTVSKTVTTCKLLKEYKYIIINALFLTLPTRSSSYLKTAAVQNPIGDKSSADARKFAAVAFTRISSTPIGLKAYSTTLLASLCSRTFPSKPMAFTTTAKEIQLELLLSTENQNVT